MSPEERDALISLIGPEIIQKIYEDAAGGATQELGKAAKDITKTFRLFLAPFQIGAAYQDRFEKYLDRVRDSVPKENQIECPSSIAGPVFENLKYLQDDSYLKDLYLNLLSRAIDKERINEAHPAFVTLIQQLSPDEARMLKMFGKQNFRMEFRKNTVIEVGEIPEEHLLEHDFPLEEIDFPENLEMYLKHLNLLNLIEMPQYEVGSPDESSQNRPVRVLRIVKLSDFGKLFHKACIE